MYVDFLFDSDEFEATKLNDPAVAAGYREVYGESIIASNEVDPELAEYHELVDLGLALSATGCMGD